MRQISRQILLISVVLLGLANWLGYLLAQERDSWLAESIAMSPDGRHLAVKYNTGKRDGDEYTSEVWIYNLEDLSSTPRHLAETTQYYTRFSISPDSQHIAVAEKRRLRVINIQDHSQILDYPYTWPERSVLDHRLSYSPDSRHLMYYRNVQHYRNDSDADQGRITIWDIETGLRDLEITYLNPDIAGSPRPSPDWRQLLDRSHSDGLRVYEFNRIQGLGSRIATFPEAALGTAFSGDNSLFALATLEDEIHVYRTDTWDLTFVQLLNEYTCGGKFVMLTFDQTNHRLACLGNERLSLWDIETGDLLLADDIDAFFGLLAWDYGILFTDNRRYTGSDGKRIILWDANNAFAKTTVPGWYPQLHPNRELMAAIGPDGRVWIWNIRFKQLLETLPLPQHRSF